MRGITKGAISTASLLVGTSPLAYPMIFPTLSVAISEPQITERIFLDIKIANYTEESTGKNRGALGSGRVVIGLYGRDAPESVKRFLATIDGA